MATKFLDVSLSTGNNDGTTWANAWQDLQTAIDDATGGAIVAGDLVLCYSNGAASKEVLTITIDVDGNSGSAANGYIVFRGVNDNSTTGEGSQDGTRYHIDGNDAAVNCLLFGVTSRILFENFDFTGATGAGVDGGTSSDNNSFVNCHSHANGGAGWDLTGMDSINMVRSRAYSNTGIGVDSPGDAFRAFFSTFNNNGGVGFDGATASNRPVFIGCVGHDNVDTDANIKDLDRSAVVFNCVLDGTSQTNGDGVNFDDMQGIFIGNRFTNLRTGLDPGSGGDNFLYGWNLFENNTTDVGAAATGQHIAHDSDANTNKIDPDVDDGYVDAANDDFNLKESRTLRKTAIGLNLPTE